MSGDRCHLQVPGVASYGDTADGITFTPEPGADDRGISAFLIGSSIGALLPADSVDMMNDPMPT